MKTIKRKPITVATLRQMWASMGPEGKQDLRDQIAPWATDEQLFQILRRNRQFIQTGTGTETPDIPTGKPVQVVLKKQDGQEKDYGRWRVVVPMTQNELYAYAQQSFKLAYQGETFIGVVREVGEGKGRLREARDRDRATMLADLRWREKTDPELSSDGLANIQGQIAILQDPRAPHYLIELTESTPPSGLVGQA